MAPAPNIERITVVDWRMQGQERYLKGIELCRSRYKPASPQWDHDHCAFCGGKFALRGGDFTDGYATLNAYHWICDGCYEDFKTTFAWKIVPCPEPLT
jgi:hypothetical protein